MELKIIGVRNGFILKVIYSPTAMCPEAFICASVEELNERVDKIAREYSEFLLKYPGRESIKK